jgi:hypothetical protein
MSDTNPYASPKELAAAPAAESLQWRTDGSGLLVKHRTVLPPVDLETGATDGELVTVMRQHVPRHVGNLLLAAIVALVVYQLIWNTGFSVTAYVVIVFLVSLSLRFFNRSGTVVIWDQRGGVRHRMRKMRDRFRFGLALLAPALFLSAALFPSAFSMLPIFGIFGVSLLLLLLSLVMGLFGRSPLKVGEGPQGWLRISKIHPDALAFLMRLEQEEQAQLESAGKPQAWRVYTAYFYRYPLSLLIDVKTGVWTSMVLVVMKWFRARQLEQTMLALDGAVESAMESLHHELRETAGRWLEAHPGWRVSGAAVLDAPFSVIRQEFVSLTDPALEHALTFTATWAKAKPGVVRCFTILNTWLDNGVMIATANCAVVRTGRTGVDYQHTKGDAEAVRTVHFARCAGHTPVPAGTPEEMKRRLVEERQLATRELEELGWNSPVREIT